MIKWINERHKYWWEFLLERVYVNDSFNRKLPKIEYSTRVGGCAGRAGHGMCEYNLNYVLQEQGKYDETICHEVCHTFAKRIFKDSKHDTLWGYLYQHVCGSRRGRYHDYIVVTKATQAEEIKKIKELLKMQAKLEKLAACTNQ